MPRTASPLRYPGGKRCLYPLVSRILGMNGLDRKRYAEPFAGGCGLALSLLFDGHVSDIHINDVDASIWAFWYGVLEHTDEFVRKVMETPITIDEWHRQRRIYLAGDIDGPVRLGFATFFLNRTNRSGIIQTAGVIGGQDQSGSYKMDCRFNREDLSRRIRRVAKYRTRIHLTRLDALDFLKEVESGLPPSAFLCVDPPYFQKGQVLYTRFYKPQDHVVLASAILRTEKPWIVTYDNVDTIRHLYRSRRQHEFDINYSIQTKRKGTELLISSKGLRLPDELRDRRVNLPQYRAA